MVSFFFFFTVKTDDVLAQEDVPLVKWLSWEYGFTLENQPYPFLTSVVESFAQVVFVFSLCMY